MRGDEAYLCAVGGGHEPAGDLCWRHGAKATGSARCDERQSGSVREAAGSAQQLPVEGDGALGGRRPALRAEGSTLASLAESRCERSILQKSRDTPGQEVGAGRWREQPTFTVNNDLGEIPGRRGNHRAPKAPGRKQ